ncbi:MAG: pentapeptide repeat-containing protein [Pirellulaceae bacterium]
MANSTPSDAPTGPKVEERDQESPVPLNKEGFDIVRTILAGVCAIIAFFIGRGDREQERTERIAAVSRAEIAEAKARDAEKHFSRVEKISEVVNSTSKLSGMAHLKIIDNAIGGPPQALPSQDFCKKCIEPPIVGKWSFRFFDVNSAQLKYWELYTKGHLHSDPKFPDKFDAEGVKVLEEAVLPAMHVARLDYASYDSSRVAAALIIARRISRELERKNAIQQSEPCDLRATVCYCVDFGRAKFIDFENCELSGSTFSACAFGIQSSQKATKMRPQFSHALEEAELSWCRFHNTDFRSDLDKVTFHGSKFCYCNFGGETRNIFTNVTFSNRNDFFKIDNKLTVEGFGTEDANLPTFKDCVFQNIAFTDVTFTDVTFTNCVFTKCVFTKDNKDITEERKKSINIEPSSGNKWTD